MAAFFIFGDNMVYRSIAFYAALAAGAQAAAAAPFPMGLDAVHWSMASQEISAAGLPHSLPPRDPMESEYRIVTVNDYAWHGCTFHLEFAFSPAGLYNIAIEQPASVPACADLMRAEFLRVYSAAQPDGTGFGVQDGDTKAGFLLFNSRVGPKARIGLLGPNAPPPPAPPPPPPG